MAGFRPEAGRSGYCSWCPWPFSAVVVGRTPFCKRFQGRMGTRENPNEARACQPLAQCRCAAAKGYNARGKITGNSGNSDKKGELLLPSTKKRGCCPRVFRVHPHSSAFIQGGLCPRRSRPMHKARPRKGDEGHGKAKDEDLEQGKYFLGPNATRCGVRVRTLSAQSRRVRASRLQERGGGVCSAFIAGRKEREERDAKAQSVAVQMCACITAPHSVNVLASLTVE